jgi:hypothetical protein
MVLSLVLEIMMKSMKAVSHGSKSILAIACVLTLGVQGCGMFGSSDSKQPLQASAGNRTGQGTVDAKVGDNGNTDVEVRVKHLAEPSRVAADASVYVVWLKPRNAAIQNVGALELDTDLVGQLNTTTPHRSFTLSVTPEPSSRMARPSHDAVFTSDVAVAAK